MHPMKKAAFYTLGCKVNQYETEAMAEMFKSISAFAEAGLFPLRVLYIKPPMPCTAPPARSFKSGNTVGK